MMKKAMVTGASGFIGIHLVKELVQRGIEVFAVCKPGSTHMERLSRMEGVSVIPCSMGEYSRLPSMTSEREFDVVYHLAWSGTCGDARKDWRLQWIDAYNSCLLVEAVKALGAKKLVATGSVYENMEEQIVSQSEFKGSAFYLLGKRAAGNFMGQLAAQQGLEFVWCTCYQPIGTYIRREQVTTYTIESLLRGITPSYGPAMQPCDLFAVEDMAYGLYLAGETELPRHKYYIGSGAPRLLKDYLYEIRDLVCPGMELGIGKIEDDGLKFSKEWFDISDFQEATGYGSKVSFENAVRRTAEWVKDNLDVWNEQ